jgi:uncharacterized lipoprotein YmbA
MDIEAKAVRRAPRALPFALAALILAGCAMSKPAKFYQLDPLQIRAPIAPEAAREDRLVVALGPVSLPDYLERPQIVTRAGRNELTISEFERWAGSLEGDVARVLVEDLSGALTDDGVSVVRYTPHRGGQAPPSCRVEVHVEQFEGTFGDSVVLKAQWQVFAGIDPVLRRRESLIRKEIDGSSYAALAVAMSRAIERLSQDIGEAIRSSCAEEEPARAAAAGP